MTTTVLLGAVARATAHVPMAAQVMDALLESRPADPGERSAFDTLPAAVHDVLSARLGDRGRRDIEGIASAVMPLAARTNVDVATFVGSCLPS